MPSDVYSFWNDNLFNVVIVPSLLKPINSQFRHASLQENAKVCTIFLCMLVCTFKSECCERMKYCHLRIYDRP